MYPKLLQVPIDFINDKYILIIIIISVILAFVFHYLRRVGNKGTKVYSNKWLYKVYNILFYFFTLTAIVLGLILITGQGSIDFNSYGVMLALAFFIGVLLLTKKAKRVNISGDVVSNIALWGLLGSIVGARLFFMVFEYSVVSGDGVIGPPMAFFSNLGSFFDISSGGFVAYGGFICGIIVSFYYIRKYNLPLGKTADIFAPSLVLGVGFARLGCNFAGCCFGEIDEGDHFLSISLSLFDKRSDFVLGNNDISNPTYEAYINIFEDGLQGNTFIFPAQIISAISGFFIFFILEFIYTRYRKRLKFEGLLFLIFALYYSVSRFLIEFIRNDTHKDYFSLTIAQVTGIIVFTISIILVIYNWRRATLNNDTIQRANH